MANIVPKSQSFRAPLQFICLEYISGILLTDAFPIVHKAVLTRLFFALIVAIFGFCYFHRNP